MLILFAVDRQYGGFHFARSSTGFRLLLGFVAITFYNQNESELFASAIKWADALLAIENKESFVTIIYRPRDLSTGWLVADTSGTLEAASEVVKEISRSDFDVKMYVHRKRFYDLATADDPTVIQFADGVKAKFRS